MCILLQTVSIGMVNYSLRTQIVNCKACSGAGIRLQVSFQIFRRNNRGQYYYAIESWWTEYEKRTLRFVCTRFVLF